MEEKIVVVMEVEHDTHRGGKAKPSSRDECMVPLLSYPWEEGYLTKKEVENKSV